MYKYYQEVESERHYPYVREVAEELYKYGLATEDKKPAFCLVTAYLDQTERELNGPVKLYYNSRKGLCRVYVTGIGLLNLASQGKAFFQKEGQCEPDRIHTITIGDKNYRYTVLKGDK